MSAALANPVPARASGTDVINPVLLPAAAVSLLIIGVFAGTSTWLVSADETCSELHARRLQSCAEASVPVAARYMMMKMKGKMKVRAMGGDLLLQL